MTNSLTTSITYLTKLDAEDLERLLVEYLQETDHAGWDGYTAQEQEAIQKFLVDVCLYHSEMTKVLP